MAYNGTRYCYVDTPLGRLLLGWETGGLTRVNFNEGTHPYRPDPSWQYAEESGFEAAEQFRDYFRGQRRSFDLPLAPRGTDFQRSVWQALTAIPYGETVSYGDIARAIGRPKAVRAVGAANGRNPLPVVVPCHRVIGSDGKLTGYTGGMHIKEFLLGLEGGTPR